MFGIGMQELLIILVVALIVVGPKKLPELGKNLGKALGQFRKATEDLKENLSENEAYRDLQDIKRNFHDTVDNLRPAGLLDATTPNPAPAASDLTVKPAAATAEPAAAVAGPAVAQPEPTSAGPAPAGQASASPMAAAPAATGGEKHDA